MSGRHTREEHDAFASGETAQVVARDTRDGRLVRLERHDADAVRLEAKAYYECPVPGCTAAHPLTTRGGSRRDHFVHSSKSAHQGGPESLFHLQGKHLIAEWARAQGGNAGVDVVVGEEAWDALVRRQADVLVTWPDGSRVAFEIEYKSSRPSDWRRKFEDYRRGGIVGVWLFGHHPARHLRPDLRIEPALELSASPRYRLTTTTEEVLRAGQPVMFINPLEEQIGTLFEVGWDVETTAAADPLWWRTPDRVGLTLPVRPNRGVVSAHLGLTGLDACLLDPHLGLITPTATEVAAEQARVLAAKTAAEAAWSLEEDRRQRTRERGQREADARVAEAREMALATPRPVVSPGPTRCPVCGNRLDPILTKHVLPCGPGWNRF